MAKLLRLHCPVYITGTGEIKSGDALMLSLYVSVFGARSHRGVFTIHQTASCTPFNKSRFFTYTEPMSMALFLESIYETETEMLSTPALAKWLDCLNSQEAKRTFFKMLIEILNLELLPVDILVAFIDMGVKLDIFLNYLSVLMLK
ncbi:hypothetical protein ACTXT7_007847 [Hymenolepis weldensis]